RVESPALRAGFGVERDDDVRGGFEIEEPESQHRGRFEGEFAGPRETCAALSGPIRPGNRQVCDILAIDLVEAGEALAEHVAAVVAPAAGVRGLGERELAHCCRPCRRGDYNRGPESTTRGGERTQGGAAGLVPHG